MTCKGRRINTNIRIGINSSKPHKSDDFTIHNPRKSNNSNSDPLFPKNENNNSPSSLLLVLSYSGCTVPYWCRTARLY